MLFRSRVADDARLSACQKHVGVPRTVQRDPQRGRSSRRGSASQLQGEASEPSGGYRECDTSESQHTHPRHTLDPRVADDARLSACQKHVGVPRTVHRDPQRGRTSKERHQSRRVGVGTEHTRLLGSLPGQLALVLIFSYLMVADCVLRDCT